MGTTARKDLAKGARFSPHAGKAAPLQPGASRSSDPVVADVVDDRVAVPAGAVGDRVRRATAVVHQVDDLDVTDEHQVVGQQAPMTAPPDRLAAHDRRLPDRRLGQQALDAGAEVLRLHVVGVAAERVVAQRGVAGVGLCPPAAAELPLPRVLEPALGQPGLQRLAVELRVVPAARVRPHVDDLFDTGRLEQRRELVLRQRPVTDGVDAHAPTVPSASAMLPG